MPAAPSAYLYLLDVKSVLFSSVAYRRTGTNSHGYRYGSALMANLTYERKIAGRLDGVVELNFRGAAKDVVEAVAQARPVARDRQREIGANGRVISNRFFGLMLESHERGVEKRDGSTEQRHVFMPK